MTLKDRITARLTGALEPERLDVVDESHLHAGHGGARPGGETHFRVTIVATRFKDKGRLDRHRMVNALLEAELRDGVHALAIEARAPGEIFARPAA
jgi:BolA protein